tara:strand:- start:171 stop:416 length:246 start_codon:yes stop_codon:yes gene_type:complete
LIDVEWCKRLKAAEDRVLVVVVSVDRIVIAVCRDAIVQWEPRARDIPSNADVIARLTNDDLHDPRLEKGRHELERSVDPVS